MRRFALACVVLALIAAACDGENDAVSEDGGTTARLEVEEFIARVDAVCAGGREKLADVEPPGNLEESGPFLRKVLPVIRDQQSELRELGEPPAERREFYLQWFEARDGIVETTALMIAAAEDGEEAEFRRLAAIQGDLDTAADKAARAYGLEVCGSSDAS